MLHPAKTIKELYDLQRFSIKMGLENITELCRFLNQPQDKFPSIHIAGTNGKGSTAVLIQKILSQHGLRVGLYTSPHLVKFNERIRINDQLIDDIDICNYWKNIRKLVRKLQATFFDATTAMAFKYFADEQVDLGVIETGLGGRLDSTNILKPKAVVLTPIDRDHEKQLGRDYAGIAREKAAIIKDGAAVFTCRQRPEVAEIIHSHRQSRENFVITTDATEVKEIIVENEWTGFSLTDKKRNEKYLALRLSLTGAHQAENAALAYICSRWYLEQAGHFFSETNFRQALASVYWPGRLQRIAAAPDVIFDVSHNEAGFEISLNYARSQYPAHNRVLVLGLLSDKDFNRIVPMTGEIFHRIYLTEPASPRRMKASALKKIFDTHRIEAEAVPSPAEAYHKAVRSLKEKEVLFVMGSHFLVGELFNRAIRKST